MGNARKPGQILLSRFAFDNARQVLKGLGSQNRSALAWLNHGLYKLKGVDELMEVCEVGEPAAVSGQPPGPSEKAEPFTPPEAAVWF